MSRYPLLYLAYGANTQVEHMAHRCPGATALGVVTLHDHKLIFRGVADVIKREGSDVQCALWSITEPDERRLDTFEAYPRLYGKRYAEVVGPDGITRLAMFYVMADRGRNDRREPASSYEQTLREGYAHFGMPLEQIDEAIGDALGSAHRRRVGGATSWDRKDAQLKAAARHAAPEPEPVDDPTTQTYWERQFWRAKGYPDWYAVQQATGTEEPLV